MSNKNKGVFLDSNSMPPYGVGGYVDAKARQRHEILAQDYEELRKETDVMSAKFEVAKQRRLVLAAEVRFLQRRYKHLVKMKNMSSSQEQRSSQEQLLEAPAAHKQVKNSKEQISNRKEASRLRLPPCSNSKPKKRKYTGKQVAVGSVAPLTVLQHNELSYCGNNSTRHSFIPSSVLNENGRTHMTKEALALYVLPILESGNKERTYSTNVAAALRHSVAAFDLNQYNNASRVEEASPSNHAPMFDLNQLSTGDEGSQNLVEAVKFEEAKRSLIRGTNDEQQNDLKFSICRNAGGEGPARVGKRKISWQDPVALRV